MILYLRKDIFGQVLIQNNNRETRLLFGLPARTIFPSIFYRVPVHWHTWYPDKSWLWNDSLLDRHGFREIFFEVILPFQLQSHLQVLILFYYSLFYELKTIHDYYFLSNS